MQFEEYLEQQLLAIENLEERKIMRKIFETVLIPLHEYCDQKYISLAEKVVKEQDQSIQYSICTGLIERKKYDVTAEYMFPMKKEDAIEKKIDLTAIKKQLAEEKQAKLFCVYLQLKRSEISKLLKANRTFRGVIITENGEVPAEFCIARNQEYLQMIQELYPVFVKNGVEWKTVCAPYLYKFMDVYISQTAEITGEEIKEISIDFEEYKDMISYDLIPLWNIEIVSQSTSGYPRPCVDKLHYEHVLYKERLGNAQYLVMNSDIEILNARRVEGDLYISCNSSDIVTWKLLKFHEAENAKVGYLIMSNRCARDCGKVIRTKAAIETMISNLGCEAFLNLVNINIVRGKLEEPPVYHVDEEFLSEYMLSFIPGESRNLLLLEFEAVNEQNVYTEDILSYLVTRMQWLYPEYICVGKLQ